MPTAEYLSYSINHLEPWIDPENARTRAARFTPSVTIAMGTILGEITASGLLKPYASGNADGSQIPRAIAMYPMVVDASSKVTISGDPTGILLNDAPVFWRGAFLIGDLVGIDATALTNAVGWRMLIGAVGSPSGVLYIP